MRLKGPPGEGARDTLTSRVPTRTKARLKARALQAGHTLSATVAELLELALDLEQELSPFAPALERIMREEKLTAPAAVARLLWMDVELDPEALTEAG